VNEQHAADVAEAWEAAAARDDYRSALHPLGADLDAYRDSGAKLAAKLDETVRGYLGKRKRDAIEVGVGDGRIAGPLVRLGWAVTGLDTSETMIRRLADSEPEVDGVLIDPSGRVPKLRANLVYSFSFSAIGENHGHVHVLQRPKDETTDPRPEPLGDVLDGFEES
jgi:SAM-dependent methyltransferase